MARTTMTGRLAAAGVALVLAAALSACGGDGDDTATTTTPAAQETSQATDSTTSSDDGADDGASAGAASVAIASTSLGDVLVGPDGHTLYMFDPDAQGDSTCYDQCAVNWPPLLTDGAPVAGTGADDSKLGTTERTDGTTQVTYGGWPVYYFKADAAAGDVNGQAVNDVWWVLDHDGEPVRG